MRAQVSRMFIYGIFQGLDFKDIHHVINYDMPEDIENYGRDGGQRERKRDKERERERGKREKVRERGKRGRERKRERERERVKSESLSVHRIGRTGRSGKRGLATTFINRRTGTVKV